MDACVHPGHVFDVKCGTITWIVTLLCVCISLLSTCDMCNDNKVISQS